MSDANRQLALNPERQVDRDGSASNERALQKAAALSVGNLDRDRAIGGLSWQQLNDDRAGGRESEIWVVDHKRVEALGPGAWSFNRRTCGQTQ